MPRPKTLPERAGNAGRVTTVTHTDERYIANSASAYGVGYSESDALANWAANARIDPEDTQTVQIARVEGEANTGPGVIDAETEHRSRTYEVDGERVNELAELACEADLMAETLVVEADEIDA